MSNSDHSHHNHTHDDSGRKDHHEKNRKDDCCDHSISSEPVQSISASGEDILTTFKVANMDCADEIKAISEALNVDGVRKVQANLMSSTVQILHSKNVSNRMLKNRIETTVVRVLDEERGPAKNQNRNRIFIVAASGSFLLIGLVAEWMSISNLLSDVCFFISIAFGGSLVFPKAWGSLKRKTLDMNVLMTVAVIGAVGIKEFSEAAAVVFLFSLSELLESLSVQRARKAIQELLKITPQKAEVLQPDGSVIEKDVNELQVSQLIRVKAGESIPVDGVVTSGTSSVNQAPLTGESVPVPKVTGEPVFAGTINQEGSLVVKVTKLFSDTKISKVIQLVEEAQSQRAVSQKFVDKFAEIYTPTVMVLALLTFVIPPLFFSGSWHDWLYKALVLLVIACPCALVLSTPVSIVSSLTVLARKGVLVKGGAILEVLGKVKALAVDKTGTLTEGKPKVQKVIQLSSMNENQILEIAKSLEAHSTHPIAQAIVEASDKKGIATKSVEQFANVSGYGVEAFVGGHSFLLGNHRFAHEVGICTPELEKTLHDLEDQSLSVVVVGHKPHDNCSGEAVGVIALGDAVRSDSREALQSIKTAGVESIVVLSGDNQKTVNAVSQNLKIEEAYGDLLPEDKAKHIDALKGKFGVVAMIGDGVNDAPAMAKSSVGIAMGFVGSDTAVETADITLMTDDLKQIAIAILAGRRTLSVIQFNIAFALVTKALFLVLTFAGYSNLWLAVAADTGASLLVIMNSLRLLKV